MNNFMITQRPTGTKAFVCLDCGKMFTLRSNRRRLVEFCPHCDSYSTEHVGCAKMVTTGTERIMQLCTLASADRPVTRKELCRVTGLDDRTVREHIEQLRRQGIRIVSTSRQGGYWLARTEQEYADFRTEHRARAMRILTLLRDMDGIEGQMEMEELKC